MWPRALILWYGCKRGGLRLPAPRPQQPQTLMRPHAAARITPHFHAVFCGDPRGAASSTIYLQVILLYGRPAIYCYTYMMQSCCKLTCMSQTKTSFSIDLQSNPHTSRIQNNGKNLKENRKEHGRDISGHNVYLCRTIDDKLYKKNNYIESTILLSFAWFFVSPLPPGLFGCFPAIS